VFIKGVSFFVSFRAHLASKFAKSFTGTYKKILEKIQWGITNPEFYSDFKTVFKKLLRSISQNHLSTVPVPVTGNKSEDKKS
jgi:hypothetical protein